MRIGLFSDTYVPDINGVASSVHTLKQSLEEGGHTVFVITTQATLMSATLTDNILRLPGVELKFLYGYTMSGPVHLGAVKAIEEMNLDLIHVHTEFGVGLFARHCAKSLHIPLVTTYHTQYEDYTHYVNFLRLKTIDLVSKRAVAALSRAYTRNVQVIIAPSEKTKQMLMNYDIRKKIDVIPTGLDLKSFKNRDEARIQEIRESLALDGNFTIIYLGRIAKEKSIDVSLRAFAELSKRLDAVRFIIAGDGPSMDDLKDLARKLDVADKVHFVGSVMRSDVPSYYHASDAFISASLTETQGLTYIEALASGLCVFARPDRPLDALVLDGETGYLFTEPEEFAEKAYHYITNVDAFREPFAQAARDVVKEYDSVTFCNRMIASYQDAIDSYHGKFTIVEIEHEEEKTWIELEQDGSRERLVFDSEIVGRRGLDVGMKLSRNELSSLEDDQKVYEAYQAALKRIAVRDYTSYELADYVRTRFELNEEQIDTVLTILRNRRFIDDSRYLRDKVDYHRDQLRGNEWIVEDLTRRGYSSDEIDGILSDEPHEVYIERGVRRASNYMERLREGSRMQRNLKVKQHLQRQGFSSSDIKEILNSVEDNYEMESERASLERTMSKALIRYMRKDSTDARQKTINYALTKGYPYEMIKEVMEELENDNED